MDIILENIFNSAKIMKFRPLVRDVRVMVDRVRPDRWSLLVQFCLDLGARRALIGAVLLFPLGLAH